MEKVDLYKFIDNPTLLCMDTLEGLKKLTVDYPYFQAVWMLYLKNLKVVDHKEFEPELQKAAIFIADRKKLYHFLCDNDNNVLFDETNGNNYNIEDAVQEQEDSEKIKNSLIDSFISSQPSLKLSKDGDELAPKTDIAEKSISENDEFITETLANIFLQQKKYDKAIDAFEKLSLKFPEKSTYFAGRIEEVKKLKNN